MTPRTLLLYCALAGALNLFALTPAVHADDPSPRPCANRNGEGPTVALVLSGGGALANLQIGAMSVLEELNIPIHCVVGTSMGAVVASLYAAGYDVDEIRDIFRNAPWPDLFANTKSRRDSPYLEKERRDQFYSDYIAGFTRQGVTLPAGVVGMDALQFFYRDLTLHVSLDTDFDQLRVPLRTVATNLSNGKPYVFSEGDLVEAMLASMAVPAVFTPRTIDGEVYVDGGLAQNLPVETAKQLGADIIIGIDLTIEPPKMTRRVSVAEVNLQLNRITVWENYRRQLQFLDAGDLLIQPDITGLSVSSFAPQDAELAYRRGREAALKARATLERIRESAAAPRQQELVRKVPENVERTVRIDNGTIIRDGEIRDRLAFEPALFEDTQDRRRRLRDLASFGSFGQVDLALDGLVPVVDVGERPLGRTLVQVGARGATDLDGDSNFGLLARVSRRPFGPGGGVLSLSGEFGTNLGLTAELNRPFGAEGRFFVLPSLAYRAEELLFDVGDVRVGEFWQQSSTFQMRIGRELGVWGVLSLDALINDGRVRPKVTVLPDDFAAETFANGGLGLRFAVDTQDSLSFPTRGLSLNMAAQRLNDLQDGDINGRYRVALGQAASLGRNTINFRLRGEAIVAEGSDVIEIISLGGFRQLTAFSPNSLPATRYGLASLEFYRRIGSLDKVATLPLYFGGAVEFANVEFDAFRTDTQRNFSSLSLYLGADTFIGPAFFGAAVSDDGQYTVFMNLGRNFR